MCGSAYKLDRDLATFQAGPYRPTDGVCVCVCLCVCVCVCVCCWPETGLLFSLSLSLSSKAFLFFIFCFIFVSLLKGALEKIPEDVELHFFYLCFSVLKGALDKIPKDVELRLRDPHLRHSIFQKMVLVSLPPSRPPSPPTSLSITIYLFPFLPPFLPSSLPPSLPHSLTHSLPHSLTHSLTHSLNRSLPLSVFTCGHMFSSEGRYYTRVYANFCCHVHAPLIAHFFSTLIPLVRVCPMFRFVREHVLQEILLLCVFPHSTRHVSSYYYICLLCTAICFCVSLGLRRISAKARVNTQDHHARGCESRGGCYEVKRYEVNRSKIK